MTRTRQPRWISAIKVAAVMAAVFCVLWVLSQAIGCAVGRGTAGEVVLGVDAGRLVETTEQGLAAVGEFLIPGGGALLAGLGTLGIGWARAHARARASEAASDAHDQAWDESEARSGSRGPGRGPVVPVPDTPTPPKAQA